jgi:hypothetical protein
VAATIGEATLVPPKTYQLEVVLLVGAKTSTPVLGSATAETSATMRLEQVGTTICQVGLANTVLQPLPAPLQAVSPA